MFTGRCWKTLNLKAAFEVGVCCSARCCRLGVDWLSCEGRALLELLVDKTEACMTPAFARKHAIVMWMGVCIRRASFEACIAHRAPDDRAA